MLFTIDIFLFSMIVLVFIVMIIAEIIHYIYVYKPNFLYDFYVDKKLVPHLNSLSTNEDILNLMQSEINDNSLLIWRQAVFISFFISLISTFIVKMYDPSFKINSFILLFISIFFVSNLLLMLINYHYYGSKSSFVNQCIVKIQNNNQ